jgi:EmrB/QacA subfamily drug resistance transporter
MDKEDGTLNQKISSTRKWIILAITSIGTFMGTLNSTIVNVALPVMSQEMKVSINAIQWVISAYLLTTVLLLLIFGKLSEFIGKKYIFAIGTLIFAIGSALCAFSHTLGMLTVSRIIQAIGTSGMFSMSMGIVSSAFPDSERGRALGIVGTMVAIGTIAGSSLGGILVSAFGWPSIFVVNVPVGIAGSILSFIFLPEFSERKKVRSFDIIGTITFSIFILILFLALLFVQQGVLPAVCLIPAMIIAVLFLLVFVKVEIRTKNPLLDLRLFKLKEFSFGLAAAYFCFIILNSTMLFIPFYLQDILRLSPRDSGLMLSVYPLSMGIVAPLSGWLSDRITYRPLEIAGMIITAVSMLLLATLNQVSPISEMIILMCLLGTGLSIFQSPNNARVMGSVSTDKLGIASSTNALFRYIGLSSGTTFSMLIFSFASNINIGNLSSGFHVSAFLHGITAVYIFDAVCALMAMAFSMTKAKMVVKIE